MYMFLCSGPCRRSYDADATVFWVWVLDIAGIWWMLTLVVFSLLWWSCRTFRAAWRFACGSHNSIFMGPRKCTSGGDRYMRSRDRYTYRQERQSTSVNIRQAASSSQDSFSSWTHSQCLLLTVIFTNPQTSSLTYLCNRVYYINPYNV